MSLGGGDLQIILRRIRHGFIICDDTELCDKIISQEVENEQRRRTVAKSKSIDIDKTDLLTLLRTESDFIRDELSHSPEWTATNVQVRRVRCETLGRLDEIKNENEAKKKVQIISWQDPNVAQLSSPDQSNHSDENDPSTLFQRRTEPMKLLPRPSPLTELIRSSNTQQNPFFSHAKFDGTSSAGLNQSKKVTIHFKFHPEKMTIIVSAHATVEETIGFICYKYTVENREPILTQKDPSKYSLYIADDNGLAEDDFPPLTHQKPFGQYDFPHLTLVQPTSSQSRPSISSNSSGSAQLRSSDGESSINDSSRSVTPSPSEVRKSISSSGKASSMIGAAAAAAAASPTQCPPNEVDPINNFFLAYESLNFKTYTFDYYLKSGSGKHVKIRLDVSGEQIAFELLEKTSKLTWKQMSLNTQRLVDCVLSIKEPNSRKDRTRVSLIVESQHESDGARTFDTYEFESTGEAIEQFRDQILNIIKLKNPQGRETYEQQQHEQQEHEQEQQQQQHTHHQHQHHHSRRDTTKKKRSLLNLIGGISGSGSSSTRS